MSGLKTYEQQRGHKMGEYDQEYLYWSHLKNIATMHAVDELLKLSMAAEAHALIAARLDEIHGGRTDVKGGLLGELVVNRYEPHGFDGVPQSIQVLPVLRVPKHTPEKSKGEYILSVCDYFEALVRDGIRESYTFADVASCARSSSSHVWEVLSEKVTEADRKIRYPSLANTSLNK